MTRNTATLWIKDFQSLMQKRTGYTSSCSKEKGEESCGDKGNYILIVKLAWHLIFIAPKPSSILSFPNCSFFQPSIDSLLSTFSEVPLKKRQPPQTPFLQFFPLKLSYFFLSFAPPSFEPATLLSPLPHPSPSCLGTIWLPHHSSEILLPKDTYDIGIVFPSLLFKWSLK